MKPKTNNHKSHKKQSNHLSAKGNPNQKTDEPSTGAVERRSTKRDGKAEEDAPESPNSGFSEYLKSGTGHEMMRMFVVANSLVLFVTIAWPNMKQSFQIVKEFFYGDEEEI